MITSGDFESVEIHYYAAPSIIISKNDIEKMIKAKDVVEQIAYALQIAKELNSLNKKRGD